MRKRKNLRSGGEGNLSLVNSTSNSSLVASGRRAKSKIITQMKASSSIRTRSELLPIVQSDAFSELRKASRIKDADKEYFAVVSLELNFNVNISLHRHEITNILKFL